MVAPNPLSKLHILRHNSDALSMDCTEISSLKWQLPDQKISSLLILSNLTLPEGNCAWPESMRLLNTTSRRNRLTTDLNKGDFNGLNKAIANSHGFASFAACFSGSDPQFQSVY
ncbi:hypothetical protein V2J09_001958 [Rumex salicifolius]